MEVMLPAKFLIIAAFGCLCYFLWAKEMRLLVKAMLFILLLGFVIVVLSFLSRQSVSAQTPEETEAKTVEFILPPGDAEAGRQTFRDLKCYTCHAVHPDGQFPKPLAELPGPVLGYETMSYEAAALTDAIVNPSHSIAWRSAGLAEGGKISRMGDYTEVMTVRQLMDLVAYLQSLKEPA